MEFKVQIKQAGKKVNSITTAVLHLKNNPSTVEELLRLTVKATLAGFKERAGNEDAVLLSNQKIEDMASSGKISFSLLEGNSKADEDSAIENALQSFEDGLVALFIDDTRYEDLKQSLSLSGNETLTFVKLTMLAGRMW